jgi:hypothetical protein
MSKTTMTILAATAAVVAVLALGVAIGFAVDSDDVDVAEGVSSVEDQTDDSVDGDDPSENNGDPDGDDLSPPEIEGFGDLFACLQESGLGLEDLTEFDMDIEEFLSRCVGGLLPEGLTEGFDQDGLDPFGFLEELFLEGGDGGLGGFEEFFEQFEDGEDLPFDRDGIEDFFGDLFQEESETGA